MSIRIHNMATSRQILQSIRSHLEIRGTVLSHIHNHGDGESDTVKVITDYRAYKYTRFLFLLGFLGLFILLAGIDLGVGSYSVSVREVYAALIDHIYSAITGGTLGWCDDPITDSVVWNQRLPRILAAIVVGVGLAVTGAAMQSMLKNPLADPYTTGVSSGAGFGATLAITLGASVSTGPFSIVANAFLFALIPTTVIIAVSKLKNASPTVLIMAGIAVMYIFNAMSTVLKLWSEPEALAALYRWQVGTLGGIGWNGVEIMLVVTVIGCLISMFLSRELNLLSTGDENARSLGIDADKMRILCFLVVALVSAAIVSFTGLIGFVGLVAPHMVRLFIGADNKYLIPASAFFGAALLIISDIIGRVVMSPTIIQVGVITAFLGGPVFLWLIVRKDTKVWG